MRHEQDSKITCSIFKKQEVAIRAITDKINAAKGIEEKAVLASELGKEAEALLSCLDYNGEELDCQNCDFIANMQKETADLIIKAKKLA
ncbi:hypothetical protein HZB07_07330 [Candidatus Saganbacteria bacterium]|nr:hypothetical protein [Candidatus Saganbacteria bacterium]